jgi:uncharacterized protein (TIGR00369 family)
MIEKITETLRSFTEDQLEEIYRVMNAYKQSLSNATIGDQGMHYIGRFLGIDRNDDGKAIMTLGTYNENSYGVAQGGALYSLADIAIGMEIMKRLQENEQVYTLEMKMNFIKKGVGEKIFTQTEFLHWGTTTIVAQCKILDEEGDIVGQTLGTFYLSKNK